jgi:hypothetical protein
VTNEFTYRFEMAPNRIPASADSSRADETAKATLKSGPQGCWLLIEHAFPAQFVFESLGGPVDQTGGW